MPVEETKEKRWECPARKEYMREYSKRYRADDKHKEAAKAKSRAYYEANKTA